MAAGESEAEPLEGEGDVAGQGHQGEREDGDAIRLPAAGGHENQREQDEEERPVQEPLRESGL